MAPADQGSEGLDVGRRCHVTLLFSDLCDYTRLSENADPEDVAALLSTAKKAAAKIVEQHGGTLNQFYGDGFLAVFGLPTSGEDDVRRAVETALELHEQIRRLSFDFAKPNAFAARLHSGIHSGLVFARISDSRDGRYEIVGDPINTAARLCAAAGTDQILASEVTLRGVAPFFETIAIAPLRLKGKYEPLPAVRLVGKSGLSTRFEARTQHGLTTFVGRAAELARLTEALDTTLAGRARLVHLVGDMGLGKTRLLAEYRKTHVGTRANVYVGCCENYGHVPPLQPFLQILSQIFELHPDLGKHECVSRIESSLGALPGLTAHLPALVQLLSPSSVFGASAGAAPLELGADPAAREHAAPSAITALLLALAARHPMVLIFDDWQWADDASYRALGQLLEALPREPRPILVITASRPERRLDPIASLGDLIELGPLAKAESELAIVDLLPQGRAVGIAESIEQRAGGNPLFLEELCQAWPYASRDVDAPSSERVPSSLHGLIQTRVEHLPSELARVARAAAVIGSEFEAWLLDRIVDGESSRESLELLAQNALVYASDRQGVYRFKHGVTRDVVYDSVRLVERRRLHAAIADAIEAKSGDAAAALHCESLAYHYAGAAKPSRAAKYAELAGDKAARSSSLDRARQHYRAALSELERLPSSRQKHARWLGISRKWAAACVFSPAPEQIETLSRALEYTEALGDRAAIAHSHYWLGWIHYALGEQERAIEHTEHALSLVDRDADSKLAAQLLANLGQIHTVAGDPTQALRSLEQAVQIKRSHIKKSDPESEARAARNGAENVPVGFAYALGCQGLVHGYLGDFAEARLRIYSALGLVAGTRHAIEASLLGLLGMIQLWQGAYRECLDTATRMRSAAERVRGPYVFAMSQTIGGYARWTLEHDRTALSELEAAVNWLEQHQMRLLMSFGFSCVAEALASDGRLDAAQRYATLALERAEQLDRLGEITARRVLARCAAHTEGGESLVREHLEEAAMLALARGSLREGALVRLDQAELLAQSGGLALAAEALDEFQAMGMAWHAELASQLRARAG